MYIIQIHKELYKYVQGCLSCRDHTKGANSAPFFIYIIYIISNILVLLFYMYYLCWVNCSVKVIMIHKNALV